MLYVLVILLHKDGFHQPHLHGIKLAQIILLEVNVEQTPMMELLVSNLYMVVQVQPLLILMPVQMLMMEVAVLVVGVYCRIIILLLNL